MAKILIIIDNLHKGGKERRLLELLRYLDNQTPSFDVELVLLKEKVDYMDVYKLKHTKVNILKRFIKKDPTVFFKIWKISWQFKPDIIHSWGSMPSVYVFLIAFFQRIPFINAMIANSKCKLFSKEWFRLKITYPFSRVMLANSYAGLNAFKIKRRGKVIYNGFNFDRLNNLKDRSEVLTQFGINNQYIIGMVAAFHPRKDYNTFLEVADEISKERSDITFLAIGDGSTRQELMNKFKENNNIVFTGVVHNVEHLMNCFDIGVLLTDSKHHLEGISNSILEMMAVGKPIIASRGGGTDEIVIPGKTGILIDPLSREQFRSSIRTLLENKTLREEYGKNSKEEVKTKFSIEQMCSKTIELYNTLK
jgi:glycosyltransferase involved in cell wall biosynthesis